MNETGNTELNHHVPSVEKAIRIIHCLGVNKGMPVKSVELAENAQASTSTCYRILKTLAASGWVQGDREKGYRLGAGLLAVLGPVNLLQEIATAAGPVLSELALQTGMTAKLSIRQDLSQVTLAAGQPRVPLAVLAPVGVPYPVVQASSGAILMAGLKDSEIKKIISKVSSTDWRHDNPEILWQRIARFRKSGTVENIGNNVMGLDSIACGVSHPREQLALTLIGLHGEFTPENLPRFHNILREGQQRLESIFKTQTRIQ